MPALEQAQYELREANRKILWLQKSVELRGLTIAERDAKILKLNKAINQRDILITDRVADIAALQSELDELKLNMRSRSYLQDLLSAITDEEVDAGV